VVLYLMLVCTLHNLKGCEFLCSGSAVWISCLGMIEPPSTHCALFKAAVRRSCQCSIAGDTVQNLSNTCWPLFLHRAAHLGPVRSKAQRSMGFLQAPYGSACVCFMNVVGLQVSHGVWQQ
jgi:hypothetical protein